MIENLLSTLRAKPLQLEIEPRLQFNDATCQTAGGATKVRIANIRAGTEKSKRRKVQHIKCVEQIGAQFQPGAFSEYREFRQPYALDQTQVYVGITRAAKDVAANARNTVGGF